MRAGRSGGGSGPQLPDDVVGQRGLRPEQHDARHRVRQGRDEGSGQRRRERGLRGRRHQVAQPSRLEGELGRDLRTLQGARGAPWLTHDHGGHQGRRGDDARAGRGEPHEDTRIGPDLVDDATQRGKHLRCHSAPSTALPSVPMRPRPVGAPSVVPRDATVAPHPRAPPPLGVNGGVSRVTLLRRSTPRPVPHPYCVPMGEAPGEDSRFESAMRHSAIGMSLVAPDGTFLEVNAALCTMLGRGEAELRATTWQELTHPDDLAADASLVQEVVDGLRDSYRLAKRYLRPDGTVVHGDLLVVGMRGDDGAFEYLIAKVVDMTDQVRLRDRYRILAEHATDVVTSRTTTASCSGSATRSPASWGGPRRTWRAAPGRTSSTPTTSRSCARTRSGCAPVSGWRWIFGFGRATAPTAGRASGSRPVSDEAGTVVGRVAAWWDSEDAHEAREALRRSEEKLRASLDAQTDSHIFLDAVRDDAGASSTSCSSTPTRPPSTSSGASVRPWSAPRCWRDADRPGERAAGRSTGTRSTPGSRS